MKKRNLIFSGLTISLLFFSLISASLPANAQGPYANNEKPQISSGFGKIPGKDLYVHVVVAVPSGSDKNEVINEALAQQGAKPFDDSEFSLTGLKWTKDPAGNAYVVQNYNDQAEPVPAKSALLNTHTTWTDVPNADVVLSYGSDTTNCPSLVRECPGPQVSDGFNDVAWLAIKSKTTLGVTWFNSNEADMALNTNFKWSTDETQGYDVETVFLHENGHVLGLGHSDVTSAVMYKSYQTTRQSPAQDDICGLQALYGTQDNICNSGASAVTGEVTDVYVTFKNFKNGLRVTLDLKDASNNPVNTSVKISLYNNDVYDGSASGTTGDDGSINFVKRGAKSGCYTISIDSISDSQYDGYIKYNTTYPFCI
ncbi:MAG: matrixin family metalloprotease [Nitrosopumilaceae archaeon]